MLNIHKKIETKSKLRNNIFDKKYLFVKYEINNKIDTTNNEIIVPIIKFL